jgi:hypothetical protein
MPTSTLDVFLSILALDAYNRGDDVGMVVDGGLIGTATLKQNSKEMAGAAEAGFFAQKYELGGGTTVISYRGTTFSGLPDGADVFNGWSLGLGAFAPSARRRRSG